MASKPGDVINAAGAILCQGSSMAVGHGQIMVDRAQAACAQWFGWEIEKEITVDLVVVERKHRTEMPIARVLLRVWPKKRARALILARPFEGKPRDPTPEERGREMVGNLVGLDICAAHLTGLANDEKYRRILIDAGRYTLDLGAPGG